MNLSITQYFNQIVVVVFFYSFLDVYSVVACNIFECIQTPTTNKTNNTIWTPNGFITFNRIENNINGNDTIRFFVFLLALVSLVNGDVWRQIESSKHTHEHAAEHYVGSVLMLSIQIAQLYTLQRCCVMGRFMIAWYVYVHVCHMCMDMCVRTRLSIAENKN